MTALGKYLLSNSVNKADVYYKTGIDESRLSLLSSDSNTLLYADDFYLIAKAIEADLGSMIKAIFGNTPNSNQIKKISSNLTPLGRYISGFINTKKDLAEKSNIQQSRFSKLLNDADKRAYAIEIYAIAIATDSEPKDLFEMLFRHLKLNSPEQQRALKDKSRKSN